MTHKNMLNEYEDLAEASVGDPVIVEHRIYSDDIRYERSTITRVAKTQITTATGQRFLKKNGREVGQSEPWQRGARLCLYTDTAWAEAERRMREWQQLEAERVLRWQLTQQDWKRMDIEKCVKVAKALGIEHEIEA